MKTVHLIDFLLQVFPSIMKTIHTIQIYNIKSIIFKYRVYTFRYLLTLDFADFNYYFTFFFTFLKFKVLLLFTHNKLLYYLNTDYLNKLIVFYFLTIVRSHQQTNNDANIHNYTIAKRFKF